MLYIITRNKEVHLRYPSNLLDGIMHGDSDWLTARQQQPHFHLLVTPSLNTIAPSSFHVEHNTYKIRPSLILIALDY
jgi:hypothetical protein